MSLYDCGQVCSQQCNWDMAEWAALAAHAASAKIAGAYLWDLRLDEARTKAL